ncbi:hypothetical protein AAG906_017255 [Vitis piasezkii]
MTSTPFLTSSTLPSLIQALECTTQNWNPKPNMLNRTRAAQLNPKREKRSATWQNRTNTACSVAELLEFFFLVPQSVREDEGAHPDVSLLRPPTPIGSAPVPTPTGLGKPGCTRRPPPDSFRGEREPVGDQPFWRTRCEAVAWGGVKDIGQLTGNDSMVEVVGMIRV